MKNNVLSIIAIILAVSLQSFEKSSKFACQWFVYQNGTQLFPTTAAEAKTQNNYRGLLPWETVEHLCPDYEKLCAICADKTAVVNGVLRPVFDGTTIIEIKINSYFLSNSPFMIDYPGFIAEMNINQVN